MHVACRGDLPSPMIKILISLSFVFLVSPQLSARIFLVSPATRLCVESRVGFRESRLRVAPGASAMLTPDRYYALPPDRSTLSHWTTLLSAKSSPSSALSVVSPPDNPLPAPLTAISDTNGQIYALPLDNFSLSQVLSVFCAICRISTGQPVPGSSSRDTLGVNPLPTASSAPDIMFFMYAFPPDDLLPAASSSALSPLPV